MEAGPSGSSSARQGVSLLPSPVIRKQFVGSSGPAADDGDDDGDGDEDRASAGLEEGQDLSNHYLGSETEVYRQSSQRKGKARQQYNAVAVDSPVSPAAAAHTEVDEAEEERRIAENLRQWSKKEARRRATVRRQNAIVLPAAPADLNAISEGITTLSRRGSSLLRSSSSSKRSSSLRSYARTTSTRLSDDATTHGASSLERLDEEEQRLHQHDVADASGTQSPNTEPLMSPTTPTALNGPASPSHMSPEPDTHDSSNTPIPPPADVVLEMPPTGRRTTSTSAFVEDLAPSRPEFATRTSFQSTTSDPFGDRHASYPSSSSPARYPSTVRMRSRLRNEHHPNEFDNEEDGLQRLPTTTTTQQQPEGRATSFLMTAFEGGEDDVVDRPGQTSWLDWLLCGCWGRPVGHEDQEARTNPME